MALISGQGKDDNKQLQLSEKYKQNFDVSSEAPASVGQVSRKFGKYNGN